MRGIPARWTWATALAVALGTIGAALAQDRGNAPAAKKAAGKAPARKGLRAEGGAAPPKNVRKKGEDPLAAEPDWPFHYRLRIAGHDGVPLAASYYPSKLRANAPVLLMIHERGVGRSGKDFEQPIADLKDKGLAEYMQEQEYAVLVLDLRGHGANARQVLGAREWQASVGDLQAAYHFLVDRHNRGELNVGKLGVIALGDGANLAAAWAATGGAVASEGRATDLGAMALISPAEDAQGLRPSLASALASLAPRVPLLLVAGKKNNEHVKAAKDLVERHRLSKVLLLDTPLHGQRLVAFVPGVPTAIAKFFDDPIKFRTVEWEPRYLLNPVAYSDVKLISKDQPAGADAPKAEPAPTKKGAAKKKAAEPDAKKKAAEGDAKNKKKAAEPEP
jgi:acetyl esterase/lipase